MAAPDNSVADRIKPNWVIADNQKAINFKFSHDGGDYSGQFDIWNAQIEFYEDDLAKSRVRVEVDLSRAITGKKLYDDSLRASEWFDVKTNPIALVNLENFKLDPTRDDYTANATLELKGITVTAPFTFNLKINADQAIMNGATTLSRKTLNLGQDSDPDADWVSEDVAVNVALSATRIK